MPIFNCYSQFETDLPVHSYVDCQRVYIRYCVYYVFRNGRPCFLGYLIKHHKLKNNYLQVLV